MMEETTEQLKERIVRLEDDVRRLASALDRMEYAQVRVEGDTAYVRRCTLLPATGRHEGEYEELSVTGDELPDGSADNRYLIWDTETSSWVVGAGVGGLPDNTGKFKYMGIFMSATNTSSADDPTLWSVDYVRAHA